MMTEALHIIIPPEIMGLPDLTVGERVVLTHIAQDSRPTNAALAELVGLTGRGVEEMLRRLRERGLVEPFRKGRARQLFLKYHVERCTKCGVLSGAESQLGFERGGTTPVQPGIPTSAE